MDCKDKTFSEIYTLFRSKQELDKQDCFTAACLLFLKFEHAKAPFMRLAILYILYSCYANRPLESNPFLTFFLQLLDELPSSSVEQHFIYCILEDSLSSSNLDDTLPQELCKEPNNKLPAVQRDQHIVDSLKLKVAKLIDDPDIVVIDERIAQLLTNACSRVLTLSENETLRNESLANYHFLSYIPPSQLPNLIHLNQFLASKIVPLLMQSDEYATPYQQALLQAPVTINALEVIHQVLVNHIHLPQEFLHYFISNSIRSCDEMEEGLKKNRQVKQVARFIQSLLENNIIPMADYFIEVQSFCVSYMKLKGVTNLYRLASSEAQRQTLLNRQSGSSRG